MRLREGLRVPVGDRRPRFPTPLKAVKRARSGHLRTSIRCAIIGIIAQLWPSEIAPLTTLTETPMTTAASTQIVPRGPASLPALHAADQGVSDALESVLSDNTRRVYGAQWRLFTDWCGDVGLTSLPAEPLTVARYLAARAAPAPASPPCGSPPPPSPRPMSGRATNRPARIVGYAPR